MSGVLRAARRQLDAGLGWAGLAGDGLGYVLGDLAAKGRWLVVVDQGDLADRLVRSLRFFHPAPERVVRYPADDVRPYDGFGPTESLVQERLRTLRRVEAGGDVVVVAAASALMARAPTRASREQSTVLLRPGLVMDRDELLQTLAASGYLVVPQVTGPGMVASRGDVVDVWPAGGAAPVRVDFFDDEVEALRTLNASTGRTRGTREKVLLLPAREERLDEPALQRLREELGRLAGAQGRGRDLRRRVIEDLSAGIRFSSVGDWLPALVPTADPLELLAGLTRVVVHPDDVAATLREGEREATQRWASLDEDERPLVPPEERYVPAADVLAGLAGAQQVHEYPVPGVAVDLGTRPVSGFSVRAAQLEPVIERLHALAGEGVGVALVVEQSRVNTLLEMLEHHGLVPPTLPGPHELKAREIGLLVGDLDAGFIAKDAGIAYVPASALFGQRRASTGSAVHTFFDVAVQSVAQLKEGDHVVHRIHGIGLYHGLHRLQLHGEPQDFVCLEYRGGDRMYLPVTRLVELSRYSPARAQPKVVLDRLGGQTWAARTGKVRDSVLSMAQELLALYARRELAAREPYGDPGDLYQSFVARFPYEETADQAVAISAVLEDLAKDEPMDRLICGDVGFGKTEVAMRAAVRVVESGRRVMVLCPTTVLAFQHLRTFRERLEGLPVRVEMLSRFLSAAEERATVQDAAAGKVDILIGTTKLLGRSVRLPDLGLMVIDEEHRFGVRQKERLKKLRAEVDVLAMSATPIPRTLEMALSGIRDMSIIATPPVDRLSVRTSVARFSKTRVRDAILQEKARGGQVYFVHNRVQDIDALAEKLSEWMPEASFRVAHGQMGVEELESVLVDFIERRFDVLVCSAIIETGMDLPNVNTMIVNRADLFGLAQLYQLRGRVGRASVRGRCVLLTPEELSKDARKRLRVILEANELGGGFQVASADLELRGGGNLVGDRQTGNIDAVGYEMWLELLGEAVAQARGQQERERVEAEVDVPVPAFIPDDYVRDVPDRLGWYRRISGARTPGEVDKLLEELEDGFGPVPPEVHNLAGLVQTQRYCSELGLMRCSWLKVRVLFDVHPHATDVLARMKALIEEHPQRFRLEGEVGAQRFVARFTPREGERPFRFLRWLFVQLRASSSR